MSAAGKQTAQTITEVETFHALCPAGSTRSEKKLTPTPESDSGSEGLGSNRAEVSSTHLPCFSLLGKGDGE